MSEKSEVKDGMRIDWDVPITMDDGLVLRADVYRPPQDGKYPVILSYGPYAKGLAFQEGPEHVPVPSFFPQVLCDLTKLPVPDKIQQMFSHCSNEQYGSRSI
jgi:hypothetical protein